MARDAAATLRQRLSSDRVHSTEAMSIAHAIWSASLLDDGSRARLVHALKELLVRSRLEDLLDRQMRYAIALSQSEPAIFEDQFKLESLVEDVRVLRDLGFTADAELARAFDEATDRRERALGVAVSPGDCGNDDCGGDPSAAQLGPRSADPGSQRK